MQEGGDMAGTKHTYVQRRPVSRIIEQPRILITSLRNILGSIFAFSRGLVFPKNVELT